MTNKHPIAVEVLSGLALMYIDEIGINMSKLLGKWKATFGWLHQYEDKSFLVAAMRCYVSARCGSYVLVPEELLK